MIRCGICDAFKPTRSHHCKLTRILVIIPRICNRCILKMDHHCPWINNCVGLMNLKFFLLLLGYSFLLCTNTCIFSCLSFLPITKYPYGVKSLYLLMVSHRNCAHGGNSYWNCIFLLLPPLRSDSLF